MEKNKTITHNISTAAILKVVAVILLCYLIYLIRDILVILFLAILLTSVVEPVVGWLIKRKIPRTISIISVYLLIVVFIGLFVGLLVPPIISQVKDLINQIPQYISKLSNLGMGGVTSLLGSPELVEGLKRTVQSLEETLLTSTTSGLFSQVTSFLGGLLSLVVIFVISFYTMIEEDAIRNALKFVVPADYQPYFVQLIKRIQHKIGLWIRGYLILAVIIWLFTFTALSLLDVKYALVLSIFAAMTEIIPMAGPLIAAVPAVFLAFLESPIKALLVFLAYELINMVESHILVPQVMQKAIGLNPVLVIIAILIGAKIAGFMGAVLAIPVLTAVSVFVGQIFTKEK